MSRCLYCYEKVDTGADFHVECSLKFFGTKTPPKIDYSIEQMAELARKVIERSVTVPGVQPKLSMTVMEDDRKDQRLTIVGALGGNYIFKPPSQKYPEMPANEHVTMKIAELFGIDVVPHALIKLSSGELSYITKRIDRAEDSSKIHMIDMFQILEAFDKYKGSMERIGKAILQYTTHTFLDIIRFYEVTVFSFLTGNNDMHLKNFSLLKTPYGWTIAPAYDLLNASIINPDDQEELALPIAGKKKKITKKIIYDFGLGLGLSKKQIEGVFKRFQKSKAEAIALLKKSFLSEEMQLAYLEIFEKRYEILNKN